MASTDGHDDVPVDDVGDIVDVVWQHAGPVGLDPECSPTRVCRNARDFTFDGIGSGEEDLATSWRNLLEREGKWSSGGASVRDLVFGSTPQD